MLIRKLDREAYRGKGFTSRYKTDGYYRIVSKGQNGLSGFDFAYVGFEKTEERSFDDVMFGEWLENPIGFGAFDENGRLLGFIEGSIESWNNRFRISNICIFDEENRRSGIGSSLLKAIIEEAESEKARMLVLETQSCNTKAIGFYIRNGFSVIGFDLFSYSNEDSSRHENRIEMGRLL